MANGSLKSNTNNFLNQELIKKWLIGIQAKSLKDANEKYKEAKDFYQSHSDLYDTNAFNANYFQTILNNNNTWYILKNETKNLNIGQYQPVIKTKDGENYE